MRSEELSRIEALEQLVRALVRDVEAIRQHVGAPRAAAASAPAVPPPAPPPEQPPVLASTPRPAHRDVARDAAGPEASSTIGPRVFPRSGAPVGARAGTPPRQIDFEELVGRYGTVALGATVILAGVGVLISWAVAQGLFGPHVRLALAALLAGVCGVVGWRVRQRSSRRFGNVLLALSLALVHAVAWGAGPVLDVIPHMGAFGLAAVASMLLAGFASAEEEQALFTVGIGGALLAPFVTLRGDSSLTLLVYGGIILLAAMLPLRRHRWLATNGLLILACTVYAGVASATVGRGSSALEVAAPFVFALLLSLMAMALRTLLPLSFAFIAAALLTAHPWSSRGDDAVLLPFIPLALAALLVVYATILRRGADFAFAAALLLPVGTLALATGSLPAAHAAWHAIVPLAWATAAIIMVEVDPARRQVHALIAAVAGLAAVVTALQDRTVLLVALVLYGAALAIAAERRRLNGPAAVAIVVASFVGLAVFTSFLIRAGAYGTPFTSGDTLVSFALLLGLAGSSFTLRDAEAVRWLRVAAVIVLFVWLRCELALAISADVATFSLILYYAASGMLAITLGARFAIRPARHAGLVIACYAGLKALSEASEMMSVALRFGAFMLVGVFLLLVAYRYWPKRVAPPAPVSPPAN